VPITDYYRCPDDVADLGLEGSLNGLKGFFRFGPDAVCYGQAAGTTRPYVNGNLFDAANAVHLSPNRVSLPFDVDQVIDNLRYERYVTSTDTWLDSEWTRDVYYRLRPFLPVALRKHLQRAYLRGWQSRTFPSWPVDRSVDVLSEELMALTLRASKRERLPFIWFWPEGHQACAILTHDIETKAGRDLTGKLMDVDEAFGFKASIQVVPEKRYHVSPGFLDSIRGRGFEINVHGLDHDGNLFQDRATFIERAKRINEYAVVFGAVGFRSPTIPLRP